jgi:methylaspartate mutase epsilon subunit
VTVPPALVEEEAYWIQRETCELVDPVLSEPDLITAIVKAFHDGRLDIPFPSNREAHGRVVPVRDNEIAIRFADTGNLPFSQEVKAHHKAKCGQFISGRPLFKCVRDSIMYFAETPGKSVR